MRRLFFSWKTKLFWSDCLFCQSLSGLELQHTGNRPNYRSSSTILNKNGSSQTKLLKTRTLTELFLPSCSLWFLHVTVITGSLSCLAVFSMLIVVLCRRRLHLMCSLSSSLCWAGFISPLCAVSPVLLIAFGAFVWTLALPQRSKLSS